MNRSAQKSPIRRIRALWVLFLLLLFLSFSELKISVAATVLSIQPQLSRVAGSDEEFQISLALTDVSNLYGWEIKLYYDPTLLNGSKLSEGPFLKSAGSTYFFNSSNDNYNATHGRIALACTLIGNISGVNGGGILATMTFKAKALGSCLLLLSNTKLGNPQSELMPHLTENGVVQVVPPIHDVAIKNVAPLKTEVGEGSPVDVSVLIANEGDRPEDFIVSLYANETLIDAKNVLGLPKNSMETLTFVWNTSGLPINNKYQLKAEASPTLGETDLADNIFVDGHVKITERKHDVAVIRITTQYTSVYEGRKVDITVTVANKGDFPETFSVTVYRDNTLVSTANVQNLQYGEQRSLVFTWDTAGVTSNRSYTIKATANQVAGETNVDDNTLIDGSIMILPRPALYLNVASVVPSDQYGQPVSGFTRGTVAYFTVNMTCNSINPEFVLLTLNVYDPNNASIAVISFRGFLAPGSTTFLLGSVIPATSLLGNARVYVNALSDWPHLGGTAYCPERVATFQIKGT